ncbi:MAG: hypothetical protein V9H26_04530 [Verrucomicrobiota bacterium]
MTAALTDKRFSHAPRTFGWIDLTVVGLLAGFIYAVVTVAHEWSGPLQQVPVIHLEARYLPLYALFSLTRGVMAYGVSFLFTMVYGYTMARVPAGAGKRGDLYVTISLQVPSHIGKEEELLWKQLATKSNFDPRKAA